MSSPVFVFPPRFDSGADPTPAHRLPRRRHTTLTNNKLNKKVREKVFLQKLTYRFVPTGLQVLQALL